jgi:hypothetical protein
MAAWATPRRRALKSRAPSRFAKHRALFICCCRLCTQTEAAAGKLENEISKYGAGESGHGVFSRKPVKTNIAKNMPANAKMSSA